MCNAPLAAYKLAEALHVMTIQPQEEYGDSTIDSLCGPMGRVTNTLPAPEDESC